MRAARARDWAGALSGNVVVMSSEEADVQSEPSDDEAMPARALQGAAGVVSAAMHGARDVAASAMGALIGVADAAADAVGDVLETTAAGAAVKPDEGAVVIATADVEAQVDDAPAAGQAASAPTGTDDVPALEPGAEVLAIEAGDEVLALEAGTDEARSGTD